LTTRVSEVFAQKWGVHLQFGYGLGYRF